MRKIQSAINAVTLSKPYLEHITNDLYHIAERIRQIDKGYFIVRNHRFGTYEVHNIYTHGDMRDTYEFTVPFDELDARLLDHCQRTSYTNKQKLLAEMQKNNERIEARKKRDAHNFFEGMALDMARDLRRAL